MATLARRFGLGSIVTTGIIAGLLFAVFEMAATAVLMGVDAVFMPLRMIGAMALGSAALDPSYSLLVAAFAGVVVHLMLSVVFTAVFAWIASPIASSNGLVIAGGVFGVALWLVNFYLIAPLFGWNWFPERTNAVVQLIAHSVFFGCPVAWMLSRSRRLIGPAL